MTDWRLCSFLGSLPAFFLTEDLCTYFLPMIVQTTYPIPDNEQVHEIVKACPTERQTMLFSATMGTKVDDLIKLSLKRPVRIAVSAKKGGATSEGGDDVEVAPRLEQEFVRVRSGNEGPQREAMLLSLLTRSFTSRTIAFFDTKYQAHRMTIIAGLCGIKCAELHGNLTQT